VRKGDAIKGGEINITTEGGIFSEMYRGGLHGIAREEKYLRLEGNKKGGGGKETTI